MFEVRRESKAKVGEAWCEALQSHLEIAQRFAASLRHEPPGRD
ncbi:hypothetical protein ABZ695_34125 [Streptomyces sp. NPDC006976]